MRIVLDNFNLSGGDCNGLRWQVWAIDFDFAFTVRAEGAEIHTSPPRFATAPQAERAAKEWCQSYAAPAPDAAPPSLDKPLRRAEVSGYRVEVIPYHRGGFIATATDLATGNVAMDTIHETENDAMATALAWASANPCDGSSPFAGEAVMPAAVDEAAVCGWRIHVLDDRGGYQASLVADDDVTAVESLPTCETHQDAVTAAIEWARENPRGNAEPPTPFDAALGDEDNLLPEPPAPAEASSPRDEELEQLRRELALARRERDAAVAGAAADFLEVTAEANELLELGAQKLRLLDVIEEAKLDLKALDKRLAGKANAVATRVQSIGRGERAGVYQQRLAFADSAETKAVVGGAAARAAAALDKATAQGRSVKVSAGGSTWAFNGVEHRVLCEQVPSSDGPRFVAWIDGHRPLTEGHGETPEQAGEASRNAASMVFIDMDPGQTTASEDTGAVADGPRKTAKRGRLAKLKGYDQAAVIAAVESVLTWPEAADALGCSKAQLEAYADKVGLNLTKHQGRRAGEELRLPEAPAAKAGKPRGRRKAGAK